MENELIATTTSGSSGVPSVGFDVFSAILNIFGGSERAAEILSFGGILGVLSIIWSTFAIFSYIVSILILGLYVYASVRKKMYEDLHNDSLRNMEQLYDQHIRGINKNSRLSNVLSHSESDNPNDWKLAIIEADIILDEILKQRGYAGNSLGERLKSVSPQQLNSLNDAWEAHKIRNRIAHDGADFILTKRVVEDTINAYRRVFTEFGVS